jgi:protein O-mannosyl-transferase
MSWVTADSLHAPKVSTPAPDALSTQEPRKLDRPDLTILALLFGITVVLYARTATFGFVDYDDSRFVYDNPCLKQGLSISGIRWALLTGYYSSWHPLTWLTYLATISAFGKGAGPFHAVNFILHAANACLLFYLLLRTTGQRWPAAVVAALWAWHPLRVESVAWVSETKDVLSMFFGLLTLIAYTAYARSPGWKRYLVVSLALLCALASKPSMVTLPAILLLLDYWPLNRWRLESVPKLLVEKIPLLLMVIAVSAQTYRVQTISGALTLTRHLPLDARIENALVSLILYLRCFFCPTHLAVFYPHPWLIYGVIPAWKWGGAIVVLMAITYWAMRRRKRQPYVWIGWLWFLGTLVPMIGIIQAGEQGMADRYTLLPSIGLTFAVVWMVAQWYRTSGNANLRRGIEVATVIVFAACLILSERQIGFWRDTIALFAHADDVTHDNYRARGVLAGELQAQGGDPQRVLELAQSAVQTGPNLPYSHHIYAAVLEKRGEFEQAVHEYQIAVSIDDVDPYLRDEFGMLLVKMDRYVDAMDQFRQSIQIDPFYADAHHHLALLLAHEGKSEQAIDQWRQAIALDPHEGVYHGFLGDALRLRGDRAEAVQQYSAALADGEYRPDWESALVWYVATDPSSPAGNILRVIPFGQDAVEKTAKKDALSLAALAAALARAGQYDQAAAIAQQGIACAQAQNQTMLVRAMESQLQRYQQGQPYIEEVIGDKSRAPGSQPSREQ